MGLSMTPLTTFVDSLAPAAYDRTVAGKRRKELEADLSASGLRSAIWFESGSWSHGTALKDHSDVDYMAWCTGTKPVYPSSALNTAKAAINDGRPGIWRTRISSPTVKIEYFTSPYIEVVPAWFSRKVGEDYVFWIPGPGDMWVESAPQSHLRFVSAQNDRLGKKLKPLVRLLKQWKVNVGAPVSSFYLEMRAAAYAKGETSIVYPIDLRFVLGELIDHGLQSMNDPINIVTRIHAASSEANRQITLRLLVEAKNKVSRATSLAEISSNAPQYWTLMSDLFGKSFPWPNW